MKKSREKFERCSQNFRDFAYIRPNECECDIKN